MEERWPDPSSEDDSHPPQSSLATNDDFFSTLASTDNPRLDGQSATVSLPLPAENSAAMDMRSGGTYGSETQDSNSPLEQITEVEMAQDNGVQVSTEGESSMRSGLSHVFVGSSFASDLQTPPAVEGRPQLEPFLDSEQARGFDTIQEEREQLLKHDEHVTDEAEETVDHEKGFAERSLAQSSDGVALDNPSADDASAKGDLDDISSHLAQVHIDTPEFHSDTPEMPAVRMTDASAEYFGNLEQDPGFQLGTLDRENSLRRESEETHLAQVPQSQHTSEMTMALTTVEDHGAQGFGGDTESNEPRGNDTASTVESLGFQPHERQLAQDPWENEIGSMAESAFFSGENTLDADENFPPLAAPSSSQTGSGDLSQGAATQSVAAEKAWEGVLNAQIENSEVNPKQGAEWVTQGEDYFATGKSSDFLRDDWQQQVETNATYGEDTWARETASPIGPASPTMISNEYHEEFTEGAGIKQAEAEDTDQFYGEFTEDKFMEDTRMNDVDFPLADDSGYDPLLPTHDGPSENNVEFSSYSEKPVDSLQNATEFFNEDAFAPTSAKKKEIDLEEVERMEQETLDEHGDTAWTVGKDTNDLGDSWAEALGPSDQGLDESWGAAFGDGLDDDGFLEDSPMEAFQNQDVVSAPEISVQPLSTKQGMATISSAIPQGTVPTAIPTSNPQQSSTPMEFFADLPTTQQVRSRKPRPQLISHTTHAPSIAPPMRPVPPPRSSSVAAFQPQYMPFQPPERLDLFPQQEAPRATMPTPPSTLPQSYTPSQALNQAPKTSYAPSQSAAPPLNMRYSPAPVQPQSFAAPPNKAPSPVQSRYSANPSQLAPPVPVTNEAAAIRPRAKSPYASAPSAELSRSASYVKQAPAAGTAVPLPQAPQPNEAKTPLVAPPSSRNSPSIPGSQPSAPVQLKQLPIGGAIPQLAGPPPMSNRFAPRTSSPLAQPNQRPMYDRSFTTPVAPPELPGDNAHTRHHSFGEVIEDPLLPQAPPNPSQSFTPQPLGFAQPKTSELSARPQGSLNGYSPPRRSATQRIVPPRLVERSMSYAPDSPGQYQPDAPAIIAPQRPRTSSPTLLRSDIVVPQAFGHDTLVGQSLYNIGSDSTQSHAAFADDKDVDFVLPTDGTATDPLQRWKGHPIFQWGCAGIVSTSFPTRIPRYGGGQAAPKIKCVAGEVKLRKLKDISSEVDSLLKFPGPLKSKNKKKDVLSWLSAKITLLEQHVSSTRPAGPMDGGLDARASEKVLLWQIVRIMVENDGILAGNAAVDMAVRQVVFPNAAATDVSRRASLSKPTFDASITKSDGADSVAVDEIRRLLLQSEREKAIWHAVDNKLWAHAMLISSTIDKAIWKQVIQEFVKNEVRSNALANTQSLAALYEVFAGNWDESVDQLVPLSARTGFHMVSTTQPGQSLNSLENLNKWQETLGLILANRSNGDEQALLALGKLLISYGRVEAAHTCYLFARSTAHFGGADDPQTNFAIVGSDHSATGPDPGRDLDSILLSEVYEFALSLSAPSSAAYYIPHLQSYKLYHAYVLTETGSRNEAMQYCDAIAGAVKSSTRGSPYYHATLAAQLDDLTKRLSQSPKDPGSGWISKPSINKVSGSMGKWFNNFIVGDEAENASTGSANNSDHETGPFARMTGGTPTISRQSSMVDLQSYGMSAMDAGGSRYAPNTYTAPHPAEIGRSLQSSYSPTMYGSSPEQIPRVQDRRITSEPTAALFGSPPSVPAFTRQPSGLSRYRSNESTISEPPNLMRPQPSALYEPYGPSISETSATGHSSNQPYFAENHTTWRQNISNPYGTPPLGMSSATPGSRGSDPISRPGSGTDILMANGFISRPQSQNRPHPVGRLTAVDESPDLAFKALHESVHESSLVAQPEGYGYAPPSSGYAPVPSAYEPMSNEVESPIVNERITSGDDEHISSMYGATSSGYGPLGILHEPTGSTYEPSPAGHEPSTLGHETQVGDLAPTGTAYQPQSSVYESSGNGYAPPSGYAPLTGGYEPPSGGYEPPTGGYEPLTGGYEPPNEGYEPPTGGYEPPSYVPYEPQSPTPEEDPDLPAKKKKSFMDDDSDDDVTKKSANLKKEQKAQRDKDSDDAFRRAAEADGKQHPIFSHNFSPSKTQKHSLTSRKQPPATQNPTKKPAG